MRFIATTDSNFTLESLLLLPRAPKTRLAKSQAKLPVDPIKGISRRYGLHPRYIFLVVIRYVDLIQTAKSKCQVLKGGPACMERVKLTSLRGSILEKKVQKSRIN